MHRKPGVVIGAVALTAVGLAFGIVRAAEEGEKKPPVPGTAYLVYENKQGTAVFSHQAHVADGFQCTDCHTKIFPMKKGSFKMVDLFGGKACAVCHNGKTKAPKNPEAVAAPVTQCTSCHMPQKPIVYKAKAPAPGPAHFDHAKHTGTAQGVEAGYACNACHPKLFARKANTMKMPFPHTTECATCHDGKTTSPSGQVALNIADATNCTKCHGAPAATTTAPPTKGK